MSSRMLNGLLATVLITFFYLKGFPGVEAIKCWECRSDADPKCADPFDNTSLPIQDCSIRTLQHRPGLESTMCRKTRQKVNGHWRFIRSCAFIGVPGEGRVDAKGQFEENYCLMRTGTYNVFMESCTCKSKDGCNSAPAVDSSFPLIAFLIAAICSIKLTNIKLINR